MPIAYPRKDVPAGYLKMDGTRFRKTLYPKLAEVYEDCTIPDLRGVFIRGLGGNSAELLALQQDAMQDHYHNIPTGGQIKGKYNVVLIDNYGDYNGSGYVPGTMIQADGWNNALNTTGGEPKVEFLSDSSENFRNATETRSINRAFNYICWTGEHYI